MAHRRSDRVPAASLFIPSLFIPSLFVASLFAAGAAEPAHAAPVPAPPSAAPADPAPDGRPRDSKWFVGLNPAYWHYSEPGLMREFGKLYGVSAAYERSYAERRRFARFELDVLGGTITYDGRFQNGTPVKSGATDRYWLLKGAIGWNNDAETFRYAPYIGFALRSLNDRIQGVGGYEREIFQVYVPLGIELRRDLGGGWTGAALGGVDMLLSGSVKSHLSDVAPGAPDVTNRQSSGFGYHFALTATYPMDAFTLLIQPYFQHWRVDDSDIVPISATQGVMEPMNKSKLFGLRIGAEF